jgi:LacI family transcriptional regulator
MPFEEVGYRAAAALDRLMQGKRDIEPDTRLRPLRVVERESTDLLCVEDPALANAIRYLREHACDPCSVAEVAASAGINRRKLEIKLRELLGHSPHDELVRIRMQAARHLLETTRLSIEEVATRSGYPFTPNFNRVFKQQEGLTAGQYRRLHRRQGVPDS